MPTTLEATVFQARRIAPGLSWVRSNLDARPDNFPVAVLGGAGFASASLALMACNFLLLFAPSFFFRCFWFGMHYPFCVLLQVRYRKWVRQLQFASVDENY